MAPLRTRESLGLFVGERIQIVGDYSNVIVREEENNHCSPLISHIKQTRAVIITFLAVILRPFLTIREYLEFVNNHNISNEVCTFSSHLK